VKSVKHHAGANICATCQLPIPDCPWLTSRGRTPVEGWSARKVLCMGEETYHIRSCPLYVPPKSRKDDEDRPVYYCRVCGAELTGKQRKYCAQHVNSPQAWRIRRYGGDEDE
jgi:hypothetical protein